MTAGKLRLNRAVALKEVDQAELTLISERYRLFTDVRQSYFEVLTLQRRVEILDKLVKLAEQTLKIAEKRAAVKEAPRIDVVQLEVDLERFRADLEAAEGVLPAAFRRLAAAVGLNDLPYTAVVGSLDALPRTYDLERVRAHVLGVHPNVRSARIGLERAQLALRRAQVEPIPNVTVSAGYTRQNENRSNDWNVGVSLPVPIWNRNQGNILAAQVRLGEAVQEVGRVENDLAARVATAYSAYASAHLRAERYRMAVLPKAQEAYELAFKAYQGGQFEYLRVLQAQRAVAEANLEYVRALGETWRSASEIGGLTLEDEWPCLPPPPGPHQNANAAP
jgi:outer membrane protein, heavy metal efflux system